jgi:outer membrane protein assembly factor BamB/ribosomal protein L40E
MRLPSGKLKLLDFGIARFFKPSQRMDTVAMGTKGYAPPEQFGKGQTDARSDLYALGVILLELATGFEPTKNPTPFQFPSARMRNASLSKEFEQIIHRANQADRNKRYPSVAEMEQELQALLELLNAATCTRCGTVNALRATRCRCGENLAQRHHWNWLMFRGNPRRTGFIPVEIAFPLNPLWTYRGNGAFDASPVVADSVAYCCDTGGYCSALELTNGNRRFNIHLGAPIRSTPAVAEENLYVSTEAGELVCLNAQNAQLHWRARLSGKTIVSPLVDNQQVYIGDESGKVAVYSGQTGRLIWAYQINGVIRSSPALAGKTLCIGGSDNYLYALEKDTGQLLWQFQTEKSITATPVIEGDAVYIGGRDGYVYAIGVTDGHLQWKKMLGGEIIASAAIGRGALCVGTRGAGMYALACHSGEVIWHSSVPSIMVSSPLMLTNVIFAGEYTPEGNLYALELESGKIVWQYALGSPIFSSPVLSGDKLLVSTEAGILQVFEAQGIT